MITKRDQIQFYTEELKELEFSMKKIFNASALSLFQKGEIYVGQYKGFDTKRGNVFVDIPITRQYHTPRLNQKLTCFTLKAGCERPSQWESLTLLDILKNRNRTESKTVDFIPSKRDGWITILFREMDAGFVDNLQYNQILAFGPTMPPFEYLQNLKNFTETINKNKDEFWHKILSFKYNLDHYREPELLTEKIDIAAAIIKDVEKYTIYILQGPPGTGKTYQVSDIVSRLVMKNFSVLVTALTNKAAIEICEKPFIDKLFEENRVSKLPLLIDEKRKFPKLLKAKEIVSSKGHLTLTTYYQFSKIWQDQTQTYDYIVVEEASQAYLTTIAAACKVGKKVIIVGDPKQIVPIVTNKNYKDLHNIDELINGINTLSQINGVTYKRKIETRRLTVRSTEYTNFFYQNTMQSKSLFTDINEDIYQLDYLANLIHPKGGPSLLLFSNHKENIIKNMLTFLIKCVDELAELKNNDIAILTPYIETLKYLQQNLKLKTKFRNCIIESVDSVQGLDVDYCFYVIPKSSLFSFNVNRFNVATSRAKKCTFILAEENFDKLVMLPNEVDDYLLKLKSEFSFLIQSE